MSTIEWVVFILAIKSIIDSIMIMKISDRLIDLQENAILMGKILINIWKDKDKDEE